MANIENNSINYELDDDISYSQISFKHHLRQEENNSSRGSMHNMYNDNSSLTTNTSATTKNLNLSTHGELKLSSGGGVTASGVELEEEDGARRLSNASSNTSSSFFLKEGKRVRGIETASGQQQSSSVFLENRDILNDQNYPKLYHRHSTVFVPNVVRPVEEPDVDERLRKRQQEMRRYSDTKLLNNFRFENEILLNRKSKDLENILGSPTGESRAEQGEFLSENCDDFDPLELNIQKMLELDLKQNPSQEVRLKRSLDNVLSTMCEFREEPREENRGETNNRSLYKSLPNLN